jgi:hypothetical protein
MLARWPPAGTAHHRPTSLAAHCPSSATSGCADIELGPKALSCWRRGLLGEAGGQALAPLPETTRCEPRATPLKGRSRCTRPSGRWQSADGWLAAECAVTALSVVVLEPGCKDLGAFGVWWRPLGNLALRILPTANLRLQLVRREVTVAGRRLDLVVESSKTHRRSPDLPIPWLPASATRRCLAH